MEHQQDHRRRAAGIEPARACSPATLRRGPGVGGFEQHPLPLLRKPQHHAALTLRPNALPFASLLQQLPPSLRGVQAGVAYFFQDYDRNQTKNGCSTEKIFCC